ncbi:MAG: DUF202 domain-containing protein [Ectothiorhodospiraceae bacterium]|jgi:uncharacterized membrane protein YidH (DUF202 family)
MEKSTTRVLEDPSLTDWQRGMLFQNMQRSQLSNERNLLNWIRTSVGFITLGFVIERFHLLLNAAGIPSAVATSGMMRFWVPLVLFILGGLVIALGTWEFFRVRKEIIDGDWVGTTLIRDALIVATLVFLFLILVIFIIGNASG